LERRQGSGQGALGAAVGRRPDPRGRQEGSPRRLIQQKYGIAKEKAEDEINDWATKAQGYFDRAKEGVQQGFQQLREGYETAQEKVVDAYDAGRKYLQQANIKDMAGDVRELIGRHPLPAVLVGMGIGYMLGRMVSSVSSSRS